VFRNPRCPPAERLRDLLAGRLGPGVADEVTAHVERCDRCQAALDDLAGDASYPDLAAALATEEPEPEPALRLVMERAKRSSGPEPTRAEQDPAAIDLSFLTPSDKPGHLGRLGHYEILAVVGRGGMGVVLKGFDEALHRVVAIKVVAAPLAMTGLARQRFQREARAAAAVTHEHVVAIHGVEEADGLPYLVLQYARPGAGPPRRQARQHPAGERRRAREDHRLRPGPRRR
jgi:serine/threonine-protein kinase